MKASITLCVLSLLALSMVLPACASLVGTAGPIPQADVTPTPTPIPAADSALSSAEPVNIDSNVSSDNMPLDVGSITGLDPASANALEAAINNAWLPVTASSLSPLLEPVGYDETGLVLSPISQMISSSLSPLPAGMISSDYLDGLFE